MSVGRAALVAVLALSGCECRPAPGPTTPPTTLPEFGPGTKPATGPKLVVCDELGCPVPAPVGPTGGVLRLAVDAEPSVLCDLVEHDVWSRWIAENWINETLIEQDARSGAYGPRLAERFAWSADHRILELALRSGVRWHDGKPFSAEDVRATLAFVQHDKSGADQKSDLAAVSRVEVVSPTVVRLHLSQAAPFLLQALAHLTMWPAHRLAGIEPARLKEAPLARAPVGTGPYRLARWESGQRIVLQRNPEYWGTPARLDELEFRVVRDRGVALMLVKRGELDVLWRLPAGRRAEVLADRELGSSTVYEWTPRAYYFVVYNTRHPALADARVRQAIDRMIDRQRFSTVAFAGRAPLHTGPYARGSASYDATVTTPARDLAAAQRLLAEAKVKPLDLSSLTFLATSGSRTVEQLATGLVQDLAPLGITLKIDGVDFATQLDRLRRGDFLLSALQLTVAREQDNYNLFHSSQGKGGQNYAGLHDAEVDKLLDQIRATASDEARHALDRQLHRRLAELVPFSFLVAAPVETLIGPRVRGLVPGNDGFDFRSVTLVEPGGKASGP